jgi:DNA-binding transcriptional regulator YhcF (GntR family)
MQNALRELRTANLVVAQQGRAFFVRDPDRAQAAGTDSERLAGAEHGLLELQKRIAAVEADNTAIRTLVMDLYTRTGQPLPEVAERS